MAQCIAETSSTLYAKKSVMLKKFKPWIVSKLEGGHTKAAMVVELSALIHIYADAPVNTFSDFAKLLRNNKVNLTRGYERCDIICDRYLKDSIKMFQMIGVVVQEKSLLVSLSSLGILGGILGEISWEMGRIKKI